MVLLVYWKPIYYFSHLLSGNQNDSWWNLVVVILVSKERATCFDHNGAVGVVLGVRGREVGLFLEVDGVAIAAKERVLVTSLLVMK